MRRQYLVNEETGELESKDLTEKEFEEYLKRSAERLRVRRIPDDS